MRLMKNILFFLFVFFALGAKASDFVWNGKKNAKFSDASSWLIDNSPAASFPGIKDNIIFKSTIGSAKIIIDQNVEFKNLIIEDGSKIIFIVPQERNLTVHGSFNLNSKIKIEGKLNINFQTSEANAMFKSSGTQFTGKLYFNGKESIQVIDDISGCEKIILEEQTVNFKSKFIVTDEFQILSIKTNKSDLSLSISFLVETTLKTFVSSANFNSFEHTESSISFI